MVTCTRCGGNSAVKDTRPNIHDKEVYRQRKCKSCGRIFYTIEREIQASDQFMKRWYNHYRKKSKKET